MTKDSVDSVDQVHSKYRQLEELLAAGEWQKADQETSKVMLEVANRTEERWLRIEDIENFPCEDLRAIDGLWVKHSNGRFGFSVQKRIYQSLGGTRAYDEKVWDTFGDRVGWRKNGKWQNYNNLTFNTKAPEAHLPMIQVIGEWLGRFGRGEYRILSHRDL